MNQKIVWVLLKFYLYKMSHSAFLDNCYQRLIDYLPFYILLKNISLIWRRHHYRWRTAKFRPMLSALGLWAGRDLYRATSAVTRDLGFSGLILRTTPFSLLLRHTRVRGGRILTRILTGKVGNISISSFSSLLNVYSSYILLIYSSIWFSFLDVYSFSKKSQVHFIISSSSTMIAFLVFKDFITFEICLFFLT
jgi:hypothetical protein